MLLFLVMFVVALVFSSIGFKKYVWFISIGYGFAVAAIGAALLVAGCGQLSAGMVCACVLFIVYQMVTISVCPITNDVHDDRVVTVGTATVSPP